MGRIVAVEALPLRVASRESYLGSMPDGGEPPAEGYFRRPPWRSLYASAFETLVVRIETDDGVIGWGEALAPVAPQVAATIVAELLAPQLIGTDPSAVGAHFRELRELMRERGHLGGHQADALAAIDIALWDAKGKMCGEPIASLLGGPIRDLVPAYVSGLPRPTDKERADLAVGWQQQGWGHVKLHLGYGLDEDLDTVRAVRSAAPELRIAVDAHWGYSLPTARMFARVFAELGGWFLEAPLSPEDVDGHRDLAMATEVPIALGESLRHRFEQRPFLERRGVNLWQPDIGRTGITEGWATILVAEAHHIPSAPHHSTGLGIAMAAGLHVAAAAPELVAFEFQPTTFEVANQILTAPLVADRGVMPLPSGPGLGISVDEDAVRRATITTHP